MLEGLQVLRQRLLLHCLWLLRLQWWLVRHGLHVRAGETLTWEVGIGRGGMLQTSSAAYSIHLAPTSGRLLSPGRELGLEADLRPVVSHQGAHNGQPCARILLPCLKAWPAGTHWLLLECAHCAHAYGPHHAACGSDGLLLRASVHPKIQIPYRQLHPASMSTRPSHAAVPQLHPQQLPAQQPQCHQVLDAPEGVPRRRNHTNRLLGWQGVRCWPLLPQVRRPTGLRDRPVVVSILCAIPKQKRCTGLSLQKCLIGACSLPKIDGLA